MFKKSVQRLDWFSMFHGLQKNFKVTQLNMDKVRRAE